MMSVAKTFPIDNASACVWKWSWSTFRLYTGGSSSCHRVENVFVPLDQFDSFHNTGAVIRDRQLMLQGQWPQGRGCEYCKEIERAGGISERLFHNVMPGLTPVDFDINDPEAPVTPRVLEIYLNNTCDLACLYCAPIFSSKINDELKKFGPLPTIDIKPLVRSPDHEKYLHKMMQWLEQNSQNLQRLSIQGGEPFLQKELEIFMDWLESSHNPDLELSFNTNLNEPNGVIDGYVERLKRLLITRKIKRVDFTCSLDCWGPQQEFIRYGLRLDQWIRNFELLLTHRWLFLHVGHNMTSLSIKTLPELQNIINQYLDKGHRIFQTFGHVDGPNQKLYDPSFFGGEFFRPQLETLAAIIPESIEKQRFLGIKRRIDASRIDRSRLKDLYVTLEHIDLRRQTNWRRLFPEIENFLHKEKITDVV